MKKSIILIAVTLLTIFASSCHHGTNNGPGNGNSNDTTFTNGYFTVTFRGRTYTVRPCTVNNQTIVQFSAGTSAIEVTGGYGGLGNCSLEWHNTAIEATNNGISFTSPISYEYGDDSGTVTITHSGTDYIQGTFVTEMDSSYYDINVGYATGSFQFYFN